MALPPLTPEQRAAALEKAAAARQARAEVKNRLKYSQGSLSDVIDQGQKDEWVAAIKAGKPELALSNFDYAGLLTAAFLLGNVAIRTGKAFTWDGEKCAATDCPEAAPLIRRQYRKGWDLIGYNA